MSRHVLRAPVPPNSRLSLTVGGAARGVLRPPRLLSPSAAQAQR